MATETVAVVEVKASVRYLQVSPYKVRPVLNLVRGLAAEDAERVLQLTPRDAAGDVLKVLESAIANAAENNSIPADELYILRCFCDEGPTRASGRHRARGRSFKIRKRSSHIMIVLGRYSETELEVRRRKTEVLTVSTNQSGIDGEDERDLTAELASTDAGPLQQLEQAAQARELTHCLQQLSGEQQQCVALAFYQGLSHAEVAEHLAQPLGTVKSWVRRALIALKDCLGRPLASKVSGH